MRGAEGAEERGAKGAEGVGSGEGMSPPQLGWGLARGCAHPNFFLIHVQFTHLAAFCEDYNSLRLSKFTKLK